MGRSGGMDAVEFGQENDALLFVGIGARDDRDNGIGEAGVIRQMGDVGRDVKEAAGLNDGVVFETFSMPHAGGAGERVDGGFVGGMLVGASATARWNGDELHMDGLRTHGFSRDGYGVLQALLADVRLARLEQTACGRCGLLWCGIHVTALKVHSGLEEISTRISLQ